MALACCPKKIFSTCRDSIPDVLFKLKRGLNTRTSSGDNSKKFWSPAASREFKLSRSCCPEKMFRLCNCKRHLFRIRCCSMWSADEWAKMQIHKGAVLSEIQDRLASCFCKTKRDTFWSWKLNTKTIYLCQQALWKPMLAPLWRNAVAKRNLGRLPSLKKKFVVRPAHPNVTLNEPAAAQSAFPTIWFIRKRTRFAPLTNFNHFELKCV